MQVVLSSDSLNRNIIAIKCFKFEMMKNVLFKPVQVIL